MTPHRPLGIMKPLGGGDPIPLKKTELLIGRRPTCDIRLDFDNISGKHAKLRFINGVWHIRDVGSTNGTTVNGHKIHSEHGLMPDDELGVAGHYFLIEYDPIAPTSLLDANQILDAEINEAPRQRSLMELAGLENEESAFQHYLATQQQARRSGANPASPAPAPTPARSQPQPQPQSDDDIQLPTAAPAAPVFSDEEFLEMIQSDVKRDENKGGK
ncbi:MAG TPA: FHA domain-containing protein [Isosphaeraceae bacterium]|nr:FHA domain-containing protein [Isosphaeraceae bacterium]